MERGIETVRVNRVDTLENRRGPRDATYMSGEPVETILLFRDSATHTEIEIDIEIERRSGRYTRSASRNIDSDADAGAEKSAEMRK